MQVKLQLIGRHSPSPVQAGKVSCNKQASAHQLVLDMHKNVDKFDRSGVESWARSNYPSITENALALLGNQ